MKSGTRIEKILPVVLCILLPGINFLNNRALFEQFLVSDLIFTWLTSSLLLVIIWYTNEWLSYKIVSYYYLTVAFINMILVSIIVIIIPLFRAGFADRFYQSSLIGGIRLFIAAAIFVAIQQSLKTARTVEKLKSENLLLVTEKYKAELDQLKKQVNPHFLFNSLNTLRSMIRGKNPKSEKFVLNLSSLYRQILQSHDKDYVSLDEEIKFLNAYIYLIKVRLEDALQISIELNPESRQYSIPIFALQLLVENCVKHNIASVDKPLTINIYQKDAVTITVSNNYQPKEHSTPSSGVGLSNLQDRYKLLGIENGLELNKTENHYTVTLKLF